MLAALHRLLSLQIITEDELRWVLGKDECHYHNIFFIFIQFVLLFISLSIYYYFYSFIYLLLFLFIYLFIHFWYRTERICRWFIQNQHYYFSFSFFVNELNKLRNVTEVFVLCLCCAVVHLLLILIASHSVSKYCLARRVSKSVDIKFVMQVKWASYDLYCKLV